MALIGRAHPRRWGASESTRLAVVDGGHVENGLAAKVRPELVAVIASLGVAYELQRFGLDAEEHHGAGRARAQLGVLASEQVRRLGHPLPLDRGAAASPLDALGLAPVLRVLVDREGHGGVLVDVAGGVGARLGPDV